MPRRIHTKRLELRALEQRDAPALAAIIGDPLIAICVMCDTSTPRKCRDESIRRIDWFNGYWESGYGVRGV
ncbi:MAG: hypothetical protein GWO21_18065, partial [Gammaproteobacteria bacterium]|nr:hypothetical protein [Gammaproteobacteria bacterium]NIV77081.1 hypothetical protein [Gammaproteobacteria bacterium]